MSFKFSKLSIGISLGTLVVVGAVWAVNSSTHSVPPSIAEPAIAIEPANTANTTATPPGMRRVAETKTKLVNYTVVQPVREQHQKEITYTVMTPVYETREKTVTYTVCKMVPEARTKTVSYTTVRMVPEVRQKAVEYEEVRYEPE